MVECLQNITRHQDAEKNDLSEYAGLFLIQKKENTYFVTAGNIIRNDNVKRIVALMTISPFPFYLYP